MSYYPVPVAAIGVLALFILVSFSPVALAQNAPSVQEYGLSPNLTTVDAMALDGSGNVWLVSTSTSTLGMFNVTSQAYEEHYLPMSLILSNSQFTGLSADNNGYVWIADKTGNRILGYNGASNQFFSYSLPQDLQLQPTSVIRSGDYLWIGMNMEIGRLDITDPKVPLTDYYVDSYRSGISDIKMDGAGNIWFVEYNTGKVGSYYAARDDTQEYAIPESNSYPTGLALDSQKRLWYVESGLNKIGMFDTASQSFAEYPPFAPEGKNSTLRMIAVDHDDNVWLTDTANGRLIKYYPTMNVSVPVNIGTTKSYPTLLAIDSDNNIWVVESGAQKLVKVHVDSMYMGQTTPTPTPVQTSAAPGQSTPTATTVHTSTIPGQSVTATAKPSPGFALPLAIFALLAACCVILRRKKQ